MPWTSKTAVEIARRISAGDVIAGFQTPSAAFGADLLGGWTDRSGIITTYENAGC